MSFVEELDLGNTRADVGGRCRDVEVDACGGKEDVPAVASVTVGSANACKVSGLLVMVPPIESVYRAVITCVPMPGLFQLSPVDMSVNPGGGLLLKFS